MRVFITGIGGFLGRSLAVHLKARGHSVTGSTRREMELSHPFDSTVFEQQDTVIHCAHDFTAGAHELNVVGTRLWMETAAALGVRQQIFLSSHSARADASSEYGRTKYEIESLFLKSGYTVLRPGLVTGAGGLYQRQHATLLRSPVVPMLGSGAQPVATVSLADFLAAATVALEEKRVGAFNLFYEPMPTYRQFVSGIREGRRTLFLPVPTGVALALASIAEWLRLPVPVKPGQIRALRENATSPWRSDLSALLGTAAKAADYRFPPPG